MDENEIEQEMMEEIAAVAVAVEYRKRQLVRQPCRDLALGGASYIDEVLNGHDATCRENFRMDRHVFLKLCEILRGRKLIQNTQNVSVEEQLGIFMLTIGHNERNRVVQELFQYSGETISRHFNNVLKAIILVSRDFIKPPQSGTPPEIFNSSRFYPYFRDCIGAIDGMHIPAMVSANEHSRYRNRKGEISQNVMAVCTFDMRFAFIYAGWEGSATDSRVLNAALDDPRQKFPIAPRGKYYVVDAGYSNRTGFLAPYRGVRYHLNDYKGSSQQPKNASELFNYRHSSLRNVIERCFGVLKARFPILKMAPPYPLRTQRNLVIAACAIHNFIRMEESDDWLFREYDQEVVLTETQDDDNQEEIESENADDQPESQRGLQRESARLRDSIATSLWNDYSSEM